MVKSPAWETAPGSLLALINSGQFVQCDLITITYTGQTHNPTPPPPSPPTPPST
jgi:hypothetical protein